MDLGYVDFARRKTPHRAGSFFVTRAKSNMDAHRIYSLPVDLSTGLIFDQTISLDGYLTQKDYPDHRRRVRLNDPVTNKSLVFLSNQFDLSPETICSLCHSRWQKELFFKWFKQYLSIKQFYVTSENAVKTQFWIAVSVYGLDAIVKK